MYFYECLNLLEAIALKSSIKALNGKQLSIDNKKYVQFRQLCLMMNDINFVIKLSKMSKSPVKDYSRLIDNIRTAKKDAQYSYSPKRYNFEGLTSEKVGSQIRLKLDLALKHNTRLLDQNSMLSQMVNKLKFELRCSQDKVDILEKGNADRQINGSKQRENLLSELQIKQRMHQSEMERLLHEISDLHQEKSELEISKNKQIEELRDNYQRSTLCNLQNMKNLQNNSKELYQRQISNLKEVIDRLQHDKQSLITSSKIECSRLQDGIKSLEAEIRHLKHVNSLTQQDLKNKFDGQLNMEKRNMQREKELQVNSIHMQIKKLRNQIAEKSQELDVLNRKMSQQEQVTHIEHLHFKGEKENLLVQIKNAEIQKNNAISYEKRKLNDLNRLQVENLTNMNQTHVEQLHSEIHRLRLVVDAKTQEIKRLYEENQNIKDSYNAQKQLLRNENQELRQRIKKLQSDYLQELQLFKIKMTKLFHADIVAINQYYQHQVETLIQHNDDLQKISKGTKERLYQSLHENDQLRKNFEIQVSKQKARVQDLRVKIAALDLQHKEQVSNLGTKMQMTSQNLFRQTEQKNKSVQFFDEEKKKYHSLTNSKDKQIADLLQNIQRLKLMHGSQIQVLRTQKNDLRLHIEQLEKDKINIKQKFDIQLDRKQQKLRQITFSNEKQMEQIRNLGKKNQQVQAENMQFRKQIQKLNRELKTVMQELGISKGFIQTLQLQSQAAIEQQKKKLRVIMNQSEVSLRVYFEEKVDSKDKDIRSLKKQLAEKEDDLRQLIKQYNALENRLSLLIQTQGKLVDFQEKVKNLGMDNNLVKNLAELFRKYE